MGPSSIVLYIISVLWADRILTHLVVLVLGLGGTTSRGRHRRRSEPRTMVLRRATLLRRSHQGSRQRTSGCRRWPWHPGPRRGRRPVFWRQEEPLAGRATWSAYGRAWLFGGWRQHQVDAGRHHLPRFLLALRLGRSFSAPLPLFSSPLPLFPAEVLPL